MTSGTFSHTFNAPGAYAYYCQFHGLPGGEGMTGTIIVQQQATATATSATVAPTATNTTAAPTATEDASEDNEGPPTRTPTATAQASATQAARVATPSPSTPITSAPISATQPGGGAAGGVTAPQTGEGAEATPTRPYDVLAIVLGGVGAVLLGAAALARRRTP
jgi:MYXO-CTERM domain-containing protein